MEKDLASRASISLFTLVLEMGKQILLSSQWAGTPALVSQPIFLGKTEPYLSQLQNGDINSHLTV